MKPGGQRRNIKRRSSLSCFTPSGQSNLPKKKELNRPSNCVHVYCPGCGAEGGRQCAVIKTTCGY